MKKVIYTAIIGNYDNLKEPKIITPGFDYICFTDNPNLKSKSWKIVLLTGFLEDKILQARTIKIDYASYVSNYDMSIWLDASIQINCNLEDFILRNIEKIGNAEFISLKHPSRTDILQEAEACVARGKVDVSIIKKQLYKYIMLDYLFDNGLAATGLLIRDHNENVKKFCKAWMHEVEKHSKRDQLSFNYVQFKHPVKLSLLPFSVLSNPEYFTLKPHK